jgi:hypothetical protein
MREWMDRTKVDLTRYVDVHEFIFDEAFDSNATNDDVGYFGRF